MPDTVRLDDHALEELARWLRTDGMFDDYQLWLDVQDSKLLMVERGGQEAREIDEDPTRRYRYVSQPGAPGGLREFARQLEEGELKEAVYGATRGGRGAYRRVKRVLHDWDAMELWYAFEAARDRRLALDWLAGQGLELERRDAG